MIEIIKHGNSRMKMECPKCHCIFAFDDVDILRTRHKDLSPTVICPECTHNIDPIFAEPVESSEL